MIVIVVGRSTSNYAIENQLDAQLPEASSSDSIDIYSSDRQVADKAAGYIKACKHKDSTIRTIRYAGSPSPGQIAAAELLSIPSVKPKSTTGLSDNLKSGIENLSGCSMDDVRVHYGAAQPAQLQAHAYAQGDNIFVAPGREWHVPHEAWHVVQQAQGRVQPTMQL
jgi:hypothetical protein